MSQIDDTQPKAPDGLRESQSNSAPTPPRAMPAVPPPVQSDAPTPPSGMNPVVVDLPSGEYPAAPYYPDAPPYPEQAEIAEPKLACGSVVMLLGVLLFSGFLCLSILLLAVVAGGRDELRAIQTQAAQTDVARVSTQYALGLRDLEGENYEMAAIRFNDVLNIMPDYRDAPERLAEAQSILAYTPTPQPTTPPPTFTPDPQTDLAADPESSPTQASLTGSGLSAEELYNLAQTAQLSSDFEAAIRWLEVLRLTDMTYRRAEVQEQLLNAHISLGRSYLRGTNADGSDQLARGVQLIYRANELGTVPPDLQYEADFVARYISARSYVEGNLNQQAREVLTRLCEESCDWSYRGVSVRALLTQVGGTAP